jgi:predicted PurR-regulated permease PerM
VLPLLLSVTLTVWIRGVVGMLLAVPMITASRITLDSFPGTQFLARLISDVERE